MVGQGILIIEDDPDITELLIYNLERERFKVWTAPSGEHGLALAQGHRPSLILLDLGLPGIQGLDVCRLLKQDAKTLSIPIVMLTARGEESDVVVGLEIGADDYITKPFNVRELVARVKAVLRRARPERFSAEEQFIELGPLLIDSGRHEVRVGGRLVEFTLTEFRLLKFLASNPGRVLTRQQLLNEITAGTTFIVDRNVDVHVRAIRKKLGVHRGLINTVRGVGYKIQDL
jgi:DNA-binding response OmpR family regulator